MSQHEIEDTVADSITVLARHDRGSDHRDLFHALFEFQAGFDCGFTHGRVLDLLILKRFTYRLAPSLHPQYREHAAAFLAVDPDEVTFVSQLLEIEPPDDESIGVGHEQGYLWNGFLYADAATPLWQKLVATNVLVGADARPPQPVPLGAVALRSALAAEVEGDRSLIAMWINFGTHALFPSRRQVRRGAVLGRNPFTRAEIVAPEDREIGFAPTVAELEANRDAVALRELARRLDIGAVEVAYDHRPPREHWSVGDAWLWDLSNYVTLGR